MPNLPKYVTRCRLSLQDGKPCGHPIISFALPNQAPGAPADPRMVEFIGALMKHLSKKHPDALRAIERDGQFLSAFLTLGVYVSEDPAIQQAVKSFAQYLREIVKLPAIPIEHFQSMAAAMGLAADEPKYGMMVQALQNVQNYHLGKFTPPTVPAAQAVEPPEPAPQIQTA